MSGWAVPTGLFWEQAGEWGALSLPPAHLGHAEWPLGQSGAPWGRSFQVSAWTAPGTPGWGRHMPSFPLEMTLSPCFIHFHLKGSDRKFQNNSQALGKDNTDAKLRDEMEELKLLRCSLRFSTSFFLFFFFFSYYYYWKKGYDQPRQHVKKQRHYFVNKGPSSQGYGFSSGHVWM